MKPDLTGFVLAGGRSSRMGTDKSSLKIGGATFLARAARVLQCACPSVKIVLNQSQTIESDLTVVRDIYPQRGALGGIHAALMSCETEFAFILAVDLPFVTAATIGKLAGIALSENESAVVPRQADGRFQPLCAVYRASDCRDTIEKLLREEKSVSMRRFLDFIRVRFVTEEELSARKNLFFNVNLPADLGLIRNKKE